MPETARGGDFENSGLGPAILSRFQVTVDENPYHTWGEISAVVGTKGPFAYMNFVDGIVPAGASHRLFWFENPEQAKTLALNAKRVKMRLCYCSFFDEC